MRLSDDQISSSLRALLESPPGRCAADGDVGSRTPQVICALPPEVLVRLEAAPRVRTELVEELRRRLPASTELSPQELASKLVGRLVCDRLR